ncbi:hypothetical protein E8E13_007926 [Curvularia kusanoi]|uniref:2EXR domain-containing protein n=1 Tax=Curvularia kusanoi TaxID=90978 RepID=A0A9P4TFT1_CURKU|nr:hypothetical protein E8E13_007926 [Curvularia kusanoi]
MSDPSFASFSFFPLLPPAVRALILHHACPPPRTRFLELYAFSAPTYTPRVRYIPPLPALFHVSRETRAFSIAHAGTGTLAHFFTAPQPAGKMFYIDFARDVIFLSSRWVLGGPSWQPSDKGS